MATLTVLFFSYAADRMNGRLGRYEIDDGISVSDFYARYLQEGLRETADPFMFSVNAEWADRSTLLHDGDQLAVIPPVSGG